jgi:hypothetical protein
MFLYKSATNKEKTTNPILVAKHGSHNQASHGRKGGKGGGGASSSGPSASSKPAKTKPAKGFKVNERDTDRMWAMLTPEGKEGVARVETAAKKGDREEIKSIESEFRLKADDANEIDDQEANSALSGVADYALTILEFDLPADKAAVIKHGSHNQASHGRKGGKGGGAGANSPAPSGSPLEDAQSAATDAKEAVGNMINGAKEKLKNMQASPNKGFSAAIERSKGVIKGYQDARDLIGKPKELAALKSTMNRAKKDIQLPTNSALDKAFVTGYADAAIQVANNYGDIDTTI